jgi:hypothetical protein
VVQVNKSDPEMMPSYLEYPVKDKKAGTITKRDPTRFLRGDFRRVGTK